MDHIHLVKENNSSETDCSQLIHPLDDTLCFIRPGTTWVEHVTQTGRGRVLKWTGKKCTIVRANEDDGNGSIVGNLGTFVR